MPTKPKTTPVAAKPNGAMHDIECKGEGFDGKGFTALVPAWLPKKIPRNFASFQFHCGYCSAKSNQELKSQLEELTERVAKLEGEAAAEDAIPAAVSEAVTLDNIKQEGLQNFIHITQVPENENEDLTNKVLGIANAMDVVLQP